MNDWLTLTELAADNFTNDEWPWLSWLSFGAKVERYPVNAIGPKVHLYMVRSNDTVHFITLGYKALSSRGPSAEGILSLFGDCLDVELDLLYRYG